MARPIITVGIATMPERMEQYQNAIASLEGQVDYIWPWYNDRRGQWPTDAGKLHGLTLTPYGYYFVCDDDYIYPPDYAERLVAAIDRHPGSICGFAGGELRDPPIKSYYGEGRKWNIHWRDHLDKDRPANVLMTCLCGWVVGTVAIQMRECITPMATDIHLALAAQQQGVPMWVCERPVDWLQYQNISRKDTIFGQLSGGHDEAQTALINAYGAPFHVFGQE